jgi:16S rRNA (adenine1518-N6/adenine1519-N6)-dimethyltransferase
MQSNENTSVVQYIHTNNLLPKKSFGQNFLIEDGIYRSIVESAKLSPEDTVIEVGPGLGTLTKRLGEQAKQVIAIEKDTSLRPHIEHHTAHLNNIQLIEADILDTCLDNVITGPYKVIANIPYYITSPIILKFIRHQTPPTLLILLMQKEVAKKITTVGNGGTVLSVLVQAYGTAKVLKDVSPECFYPAPKVTSSILQITPYTTPRVTSSLQQFERMVKIGFSQKRKMLTHNLHAAFRISKDLSRQILTSIAIPEDIRAERLTIEQWDLLTQKCIPLLEEKPSSISDEETTV